MLTLDGSIGEGGGQILRTALSLSLVTGTPFRIDNVRAGRSNPGLARQHRTAVRAAAEVGRAEVEGDAIGSTTVTFSPSRIRPGSYRFSTEGAGSATLVLQTVLPPLSVGGGPSELVVEGGTHNPAAPPHEFVARSYGPQLERMGPGVRLELERPGFFPAGGGSLRAAVEPVPALRPLRLERRGAVRSRRARARLSALPRHIARRELDTLRVLLGLEWDELETLEVDEPQGPGNAVLVEIGCVAVTGVFTGFGRKGVPAEEVAREAAEAARRWEEAEVAADPHLADQLLLPMAIAGGGSFTTTEPNAHLRTGARIVERFLPVEVSWERRGGRRWNVTVG